jgi:hypothetical protein
MPDEVWWCQRIDAQSINLVVVPARYALIKSLCLAGMLGMIKAWTASAKLGNPGETSSGTS